MPVVDPDPEGGDLVDLCEAYGEAASDAGEVFLRVSPDATTPQRMQRYQELGITWLGSYCLDESLGHEGNLAQIASGHRPDDVCTGRRARLICPDVRLWPGDAGEWYVGVMQPTQPQRRTEGPAEEALRLHPHYRGKVQMMPKCPIRGLDDFAIWYTPGVAAPSRAIAEDPELVFEPHQQGQHASPSSRTAAGCSAWATSVPRPACR